MNLITKLFGKTYNTVSPEDARSILDAGGILVDVRTGAEWNRGHAPEAIHIPLESIGRKDDRIRTGAPIVVMCQSGHRSAVAARVLAGQGQTVSSLAGGLPRWAKAGNPIDKSEGGSPSA